MKPRLLPFIALLLLIVPQIAIAWGPKGHRIVGEIASRHLTHRSKKAIAHILGSEHYQKHALAGISTWPDDIRPDPEWNNRNAKEQRQAEKDAKHWYDRPLNTFWHFATVPTMEDLDKLNQLPEKYSKGLIIFKLRQSEDILRNKIPGDKKLALTWLVHLVGDIHQPLHVGNGKDRGGNRVAVKWFGNITNLHKVWDEEMIEKRGFSFTEFAEILDETITAEDATNWQGNDYVAWAGESVLVRREIYGADHWKWEIIPAFGYQYVFDHKKALDTRLKQAGLRLAKLLNDIFQNYELEE